MPPSNYAHIGRPQSVKLVGEIFKLCWLILLVFAQTAYAVDGDLDTAFNPSTNNTVDAIAVQADGRILIGGNFTMVNGATRNRIARLMPDGTLDTSFAIADVNGFILAMAIQTDGKIVLAGSFSTVNGEQRNQVARLNRDGILDDDFEPDIQGFLASVSALALQTVGDSQRIVIGGLFNTTVDGTTYQNIARLNADGRVDPSFTASNPDSQVFSIALDSNNGMFIAGVFSMLGGVERDVARLNANGSVDMGFDSPRLSVAGVNASIFVLAVQADNSLLVGGNFNTVATQTRNGIARLDASGRLDMNFAPALPTQATIRAVTVQAGGKILLGGEFGDLSGVANTANLARLNVNGGLDTSFTPNVVANTVQTIILQADDNILLGGQFSNVGGQTRMNIARLENTLVREIAFTAPNQALSQVEGNGSGSVFEFNVSRSPATAGVSSVDYSVFRGVPNEASADDFVDNVFARGRLEFADGDSNRNISITVNGDTQAENDEVFIVQLTNPVNATLGTAQQARGIIENDDSGNIQNNNPFCQVISARNNKTAVVCL